MKIIERMAAIIELPNSVLKHYKVDFYKYDTAIMEMMAFPGMKFLWVVRTMGTHLIPVGLHHRNALEIEAALDSSNYSDNQFEYYVITISTADGDGQIKAISLQQAKDLAKEKRFTHRNGLIFSGDKVIVSANCVLERNESRLSCTVRYLTGTYKLSAFERHVLKIVSGCVASAEAQSLFVSVKDALIDGKSLFQVEEPQFELVAA